MSFRPLVLVLLAAAVTVPLTRFLEPIERYGFDLRLGLRRGALWPGDLVMVPIDDAAMKKYGRIPWAREKYAELFEDLRRDGAKTILVDLIFGAPATPDGDARLASSLSHCVLAVGFDPHGNEPPAGPALRRALLPAPAFRPADPAARLRPEDLVVPLDAFAEAADGIGQTVFANRNDDAVRSHLPLLHVEGEQGSLPSLPLLAWARQRGLDPAAIAVRDGALVIPGGARIPLYNGEMYLDMVPAFSHRAPRDLPPSVDVRDVLEHPGSPEMTRALSGKLALVHVDSVSDPDTLVSPVSPTTPGGLLLAYAIRTFAAGRAPRPVSKWPLLGALLAASLGAAVPLSRRSTFAILSAAMGAVVALVVGSAMLARVADLFPYVVEPSAFLLLAGAALAIDASRAGERERHALAAEREKLKALLASSQSGASAPAVEGRAVTSPTAAGTVRLAASAAPASEAGAKLPVVEPGRALAEPIELGRYTVMRSLGRGGMGAIFLARDRDLDRLVAIKVLEATDPEAFTRFRREALAVARITHPNVVQIHEVGFDAQAPFLVMEYVAGGSLSDLLRDPDVPSPLPWERATRIAAGVAHGLGAAHEAGIVHRDVKPSNVLLVSRDADAVKIADFGIAKLGHAEALTREGSFIGTIGYMSPEQAMGLAVDARSDVYSLGLAWFRMLTGRAAFEGSTAQVLRTAAAQPVPDPRAHVASLPGAVAEALARLTALDRAARVRDGNEAAALLESLLAR